jgi:hypothetical protein
MKQRRGGGHDLGGRAVRGSKFNTAKKKKGRRKKTLF